MKIIKYEENINNPKDNRDFYIGRLVQVDLPEDPAQRCQWSIDNANRCGVVVQIDDNGPWYKELYVQMSDTAKVEHMPSNYYNILENDNY